MQAPEAHTPRLNARFFLGPQGWPYLLVPFIPLAVALDIANAGDVLVFVCSALGIIPTAALMGRATEELAARSGPGIGGLLNVTFGNAPELIIALFALGNGLHELVKATLIGSIIGNVLLVLGAWMLVGAWRRRRRRGRDVRHPGPFGDGGLGVARPVGVLHRRDRRSHRRERGRALGRRARRAEGQDGPVDQHRDRVGRPSGSVCDAGAGARRF